MAISEDLKNVLAQLNNLSESRRIELIRQAILEEFSNVADEIAILRKSIAYLFDISGDIYKEGKVFDEFVEYNNKIEKIKTQVTEAVTTKNNIANT